MKHDRIDRGSLDYSFYRHDKSQTRFRGPRPDLKRPFCAFLGGNETFGKYIPFPFTQHLQRRLNMPCANFAVVNAGVDFFLNDPSVLMATAEARVTVIGIMGAQNLSNRFYKVHPRRNDRFTAPSKILQTLYKEVDFTDIHFTGHLLQTLARENPVRFGIVVEELKIAWIARMTSLLERIKGKTVLLWAAAHPPADCLGSALIEGVPPEPMFVDQAMIDAISPMATEVVECVANSRTQDPTTKGMVYSMDEAGIARLMPGPEIHQAVADTLGPVLERMV